MSKRRPDNPRKNPHTAAWGLRTIVLVGILQGSAVSPINAQVTPDNTLGNSASVVTPQTGQNLLIEGGTRNHSNLFHSFSEFNINNRQQVFFANPPGINNIITRVTGGNTSQINGVLGVNGLANLFLINPNGIVFGKGARLDMQGAFIGSTAASLNFADENIFSAEKPNIPSLLTINVPVGLQYGNNPAPIELKQANLAVKPGQILGLIGGNVSLDNTTLTAPGGRVYLGGMLSPGIVNLSDLKIFNFPVESQLGNISLINLSRVNVAAGGNGDIIINANNLHLNNSKLQAGIAENLGNQAAISGNIEIAATGNTIIKNQSNIINTLKENSSGNGGKIAITTNNFFLKDSRVTTDTFSSGNAGDLVLQSANKVEIISSPINLTLRSKGRKGLFSRTERNATGNGGNITVTGKDVTISGIGGIDSGTGTLGNGGRVHIESDHLNILEGGGVLSNTNGFGDAGGIFIAAGDIDISNRISDPEFADFDRPPGGIIADIRRGARGRGNGGTITIETGSLRVRDGAFVTTDTKGRGDSGDINIRAREQIEVLGSNNNVPSQLVAAVRRNAAGSGGNLFLTTENLIVRDGSLINVGSRGRGDAGNLTIVTGKLSVSDRAQISVSSLQQGAAGNLTIQGNQIFLNNATITAESVAGNKGSIYLSGADIRFRQGSRITTNALQTATGGNIEINTDTLVALENSDITANAKTNFGGRVIVNATGIFGTQFREFLTPESDITATSALGTEFNGVVEINTPDVDPTSGLVELPSGLTDAANQITAACPADAGNTFIITGRGGLPTDPKDILRSQVLIEDWRVSLNYPKGRVAKQPQQINPPRPIIEAQGWKINEQGSVELVAGVSENRHGLLNSDVNC